MKAENMENRIRLWQSVNMSKSDIAAKNSANIFKQRFKQTGNVVHKYWHWRHGKSKQEMLWPLQHLDRNWIMFGSHKCVLPNLVNGHWVICSHMIAFISTRSVTWSYLSSRQVGVEQLTASDIATSILCHCTLLVSCICSQKTKWTQ